MFQDYNSEHTIFDKDHPCTVHRYTTQSREQKSRNVSCKAIKVRRRWIQARRQESRSDQVGYRIRVHLQGQTVACRLHKCLKHVLSSGCVRASYFLFHADYIFGWICFSLSGFAFCQALLVIGFDLICQAYQVSLDLYGPLRVLNSWFEKIINYKWQTITWAPQSSGCP